VISIEDHRSKRSDRQVLRLNDFTDPGVASLEESRAPESSKAFYRELEPKAS
jgi:hypothetical protein